MFVKICGITSEEDALLAVAMGADAVGFILAPSPRQIAPVRAGDIAKRLPPEVLTVGVFRDEVPKRVVELVHKTGLKAVQLHGHESADDTRLVREQVPYVIKVFKGGSDDLTDAGQFGADVVMVDSDSPGHGQVFDWSRVTKAARELPRLLLAGGLTPDNVGDAIRAVRPWGVDVATGVEAAPGRKDTRLVKRFLSEARRAAADVADMPVATESTAESGPYDWEAQR